MYTYYKDGNLKWNNILDGNERDVETQSSM